MNRMYLNGKEGKKYGMPRYYKDKIYDDMQRREVGRETLWNMINKERKAEKANPRYWQDKFASDQQKFIKRAFNDRIKIEKL